LGICRRQDKEQTARRRWVDR